MRMRYNLDYRFEILFPVMARCLLHLNRVVSWVDLRRCFTPTFDDTLFRQRLKLANFNSRRISFSTSPCDKPN